ncbi:MAG: ABC transporter ATP-binding protein [Peptoanaerobacter stomatis]|uniref:ABC transporter ATP-binding protein n=1 Tax=Clostridia TaxID=186801 RepID=UPI003F9F152C
MENKAVMTVEGVRFSYGKNEVLKGIDLEIEENKITTFLGGNGCGKSTLFSLMTKSLNVSEGEICLRNMNIKDYSLKKFAQNVAIVHQYNKTSLDITVEQLVAFGRTPYRRGMVFKTKEDEEIVDRAMEVTDIKDLRHREIGRLSGGQRQRVWIAMSIAQDTKILFLDEPTTYLDIRYQIDILELVRKLNREYCITIVMVLHDMNQAIAYSDNIIAMKQGKIMATGNPKKIIDSELIENIYGVKLPVVNVNGEIFVMNSL